MFPGKTQIVNARLSGVTMLHVEVVFCLRKMLLEGKSAYERISDQ